MTKEIKQLLQQFSNKYEDVSQITVYDYEQFLNEKIEEKVDSKKVQELRNILNLYYLETKEHQVSFPSFLIRYFSVYDITYGNNAKTIIVKNGRKYPASLYPQVEKQRFSAEVPVGPEISLPIHLGERTINRDIELLERMSLLDPEKIYFK